MPRIFAIHLLRHHRIDFSFRPPFPDAQYPLQTDLPQRATSDYFRPALPSPYPVSANLLRPNGWRFPLREETSKPTIGEHEFPNPQWGAGLSRNFRRVRPARSGNGYHLTGRQSAVFCLLAFSAAYYLLTFLFAYRKMLT